MEKRRVIKQYSEAFKHHVIKEVEEGLYGATEACIRYGIPQVQTLNRWRRKYGKLKQDIKYVRVIMKGEKDKLKLLEQALIEEKIKNKIMQTMLEVYEEDYGEDVKKKLSIEQLKDYEEKRKLLKSL